MKADTERPKPSRIVLVVGVDLSDVSEHLLAQARALIGPVDEAETHVVHVVHPDSFTKRLAHPIHSERTSAYAPKLNTRPGNCSASASISDSARETAYSCTFRWGTVSQ